MKCENGCGQEATYTTWNKRQVCSKVPARCPAVKARMQKTSMERYGVANPSSSSKIKEKRKEVLLEKYGVENASHIPEAKQKITDALYSRWANYREGKEYNNEGLTYDQYRHRVQQYSDTQYNLHKETLDPEGLRSKHYHLDHIYSVADAWNNDVPVNVVGHISNLQIISDKENYAKHLSSHKSLEELYESAS